jgi:hypothetical protein
MGLALWHKKECRARGGRASGGQAKIVLQADSKVIRFYLAHE